MGVRVPPSLPMSVTFSEFRKTPRLVAKCNTFLCDQCGSPYSKSRGQVNRALSLDQETMFCSKACHTACRAIQHQVSCETRGSPVLKSKAKLKKTRHHFCSQSCSTSFYNRVSPKRTAKKKACGRTLCPNIISTQRKFCVDCRPAAVTPSNLDAWLRGWGTLGGMQRRAKYQIDAQVRHIARIVYRVLGRSRRCHLCPYDKHIDVCHLRDIMDFPPSALIAEVNHPDNLLGLCRNHHWEFDHGLLSAEDKHRLDVHLRLVAESG
jgi:hypothetical protein